MRPASATRNETGRVILDVYNTDFAVEHKSDASPLTEADRRSHELIAAGLADCPVGGRSLPVLSEEGRQTPYAERKDWERYWLVDPLDGTREFVNRNGEFTVNIALIEACRPVLGVVYVPVQNVLYAGFSGGCDTSCGRSARGAYRFPDAASLVTAGEPEELRNAGYRLQDSTAADPGLARVAGSRSHRRPRFEQFLDELRRNGSRVEVIPAGSSLKFCLVAEGKADLYPRFGPTWEWDTGAGHAVANGAGRRVLAYGTETELVYNKEDLHNGPFICRSQAQAPEAAAPSGSAGQIAVH